MAGGRGQGDKATGWAEWRYLAGRGGAGPRRAGEDGRSLALSLACSHARSAGGAPLAACSRSWARVAFLAPKEEIRRRQEQQPSFLHEAPARLALRKPRVSGHPGRVDFWGDAR